MHGRPPRDTTSSSALKSEQKAATGGHFHQPTSTVGGGGGGEGGRGTPTHKQNRLLVPPNGPQHGAAISHVLLSCPKTWYLTKPLYPQQPQQLP